MQLNINIKEWSSLQALLERFIPSAHPDDINHLNQVRRRMRSLVGEALKDIDKDVALEGWIQKEQEKIKSIQTTGLEHRANMESCFSASLGSKSDASPPSTRDYPQQPVMPKPGRKASPR